ncbi:hypothetical protein HanPSC8_Chr15g0654981 [Helianthus annuus]|nr:hypothetical protein HanPSC8_Chr15g0654981 [Helianthus annuus]
MRAITAAVGRERETQSRGSNGTIVAAKVSNITFSYISRLMMIADDGGGRRQEVVYGMSSCWSTKYNLIEFSFFYLIIV